MPRPGNLCACGTATRTAAVCWNVPRLGIPEQVTQPGHSLINSARCVMDACWCFREGWGGPGRVWAQPGHARMGLARFSSLVRQCCPSV
eukprot:26181-Chlamydomonas_euryale.AAC.2